MEPELILTPTDFVAIVNQTIEFALPYVYIEGELSNFRISKKQWVYFDLKDDYCKVNCFASTYVLPGPLKDGMIVRVSGQPRMHPQFGFTMNVQNVSPVGEGTIKKAHELLKAQLAKEGLFAVERKRLLPYPPTAIALITSKESAAYSDFTKIANNRWPFLTVNLYDVPVQGESAPKEIIKALDKANQDQEVDIIVVTRGGGSLDDLAAYNDERLVRAASKSRIPVLAAVGHERDELLIELVADKRASTPSNAAELLLPDKKEEAKHIEGNIEYIKRVIEVNLANQKHELNSLKDSLRNKLNQNLEQMFDSLKYYQKVIESYNPANILKRGFAVVRNSSKVIKSTKVLKLEDVVNVEMRDGSFDARVKGVKFK